MGKQNDIDELLGSDPAPKTKVKPAKSKTEAKPAAKATKAPAAKTSKTAKAEPKAKKVKEPVVFADGEREEIAKKVKKLIAKSEATSKELAAKLDIPTRKLRRVLHSMHRAGDCVLEAGESRAAGMMVYAAA